MASRQNKLYTLSYFKKRLRDAGWQATTVFKKFADDDQRYWIIMIGDLNIQCTCIKYKDALTNNTNVSFKFTDGNQNLKIDKHMTTQSMNVIVEFLNSLNKV